MSSCAGQDSLAQSAVVPGAKDELSVTAEFRHELLTPMNHIIGYSEMLVEEAVAAGLQGGIENKLIELHQRARQLLESVTAIFNPGSDVIESHLKACFAVTGIVERLKSLASNPEQRLQQAFLPDLQKMLLAATKLLGHLQSAVPASIGKSDTVSSLQTENPACTDRLLVVDDVDANREVLSRRLERLGYSVETAENGYAALEGLRERPFDLVLLDVMMPQMDGYEVLCAMKADPQWRHIPVIMISALTEIESMARCIEMGAEDYLPKPFNPVLLKARIGASLEKKHLRDRDMAQRREIELYANHLEDLVQEKVRAISQTQLSTIFALSRLAESRDPDTGAHLERLREYCRALAVTLAHRRAFPQIDNAFIEDLYTASALHDIGKVGIPDRVLQKPAELTEQEFAIMQTHTSLGADTLRAVDREHPGNGFIRLGIEVAESHHECWDGSGYPYGLSGEAIPLSARILALADIYDALRSRRCYKESYDHAQARTLIARMSGSHFDPRVADGFLECEKEFESIWSRLNGVETSSRSKS